MFVRMILGYICLLSSRGATLGHLNDGDSISRMNKTQRLLPSMPWRLHARGRPEGEGEDFELAFLAHFQVE